MRNRIFRKSDEKSNNHHKAHLGVRLYSFIFLLSIGHSVVLAQDDHSDFNSLPDVTSESHPEQVESRFDKMMNTAWDLFLESEYEAALENAHAAFAYANENDRRDLAYSMYWLLGDIHYYQDHQDSARHYYLKGIEQHSIEGDSSSLAELYVSMAWTYYEGNLLDSVGLYSLLAMDIARKVGYTQRWLETNRLMGDLFYYVNDYTHAMIYFRQGIDSIPLTDTLNEFELTELAGIYASMSSTLAELGELKEARIWNDRSDSIVSILQDSFHLIWNLYGHGYLDIYEGNYSSGIQKCKEAVTYFASSEEPSLISGCLECVGRGFLLMGEPDSAIVYLIQALEENTTENEFSFYSDVHELLSQAYEEVGDMSKSMFHQKRFKFYADSLQDIAQKSNVVLLQTEFQFRKVQAEKAQLEAISRRDEANIKGQRTANLLITLALVLTGLLAGGTGLYP